MSTQHLNDGLTNIYFKSSDASLGARMSMFQTALRLLHNVPPEAWRELGSTLTEEERARLRAMLEE